MQPKIFQFLAGIFLLALPLQATVLSYSGNLRTDANVTSCGSGCTLNSSNTDSDYAQFAAYVVSFAVISDSDVTILTTGYGAGGLEPYLSLFDSAGNFLNSTYSGAYCPTGALTVNGACDDVQLNAGLLAAGTYQLALTAFENLSLAENYGSGTLTDGFTGLGNLNSPENLNYAFTITETPLKSSAPEPSTWILTLSMILFFTTKLKGKHRL